MATLRPAIRAFWLPMRFCLAGCIPARPYPATAARGNCHRAICESCGFEDGGPWSGPGWELRRRFCHRDRPQEYADEARLRSEAPARLRPPERCSLLIAFL